MATWNVQGCRGKMQEMIKEMEQLRINIASITETKKKSSGTEVIGNYLYFCSSVPKENRAKRGVSLLIHKSGNIILLTGNVSMNEL
jgi:exonuclease III